MAEILKELREFRTETSASFGALKTELNELRAEFTSIKKRMEEAEQRIVESEDYAMKTSNVLIQVVQMQKQLEMKCEALESQARKKNMRIYSVPEGCEENNIIEFVNKLAREKLDVIDDLNIERAHRVGPKMGQRERPRAILVRFQSYAMKQKVLEAAWRKRNVQVTDQRIYFDEDFTSAVFKERAKYKEVRKILNERKVKSRILFPARLKLFYSWHCSSINYPKPNSLTSIVSIRGILAFKKTERLN
uniref:L1 transposable element RRM domain-containing protein n=1 Tax=Nothobranchius furzeri TaxID=105023 RepID=A0A8C6M558_NOTFU